MGTRVNYKSDVPPLTLQMTLGGEVVDVPSHDFVLRFFTNYPQRHYDCSYEGGAWKNMEQIDATHVKVYIKNHGLGVGELRCMYISKVDRSGYEHEYYQTYSVTGLDVELVGCNGDATDRIDAEIAIDIEGVLADCKAATAAALEIYERLNEISLGDYYTKEESNATFHPLGGSTGLDIKAKRVTASENVGAANVSVSGNLNSENVWTKTYYLRNYNDTEDSSRVFQVTNRSGRIGNYLLMGNTAQTVILPWPNTDEQWTVAMTKDLPDMTGYYTKTESNALLAEKSDKPVYITVRKTGSNPVSYNVREDYSDVLGYLVSGKEVIYRIGEDVHQQLFKVESFSGTNIVATNITGSVLERMTHGIGGLSVEKYTLTESAVTGITGDTERSTYDTINGQDIIKHGTYTKSDGTTGTFSYVVPQFYYASAASAHSGAAGGLMSGEDKSKLELLPNRDELRDQMVNILRSMGVAIDSAGSEHPVQYVAQDGDYYYDVNQGVICHQENGTAKIVGYPKGWQIYYNLVTGKLYRWSGNTFVALTINN